MVNFQSGLLGISETTSDMRDLLKHETQDVRAAERSHCSVTRSRSGLVHSRSVGRNRDIGVLWWHRRECARSSRSDMRWVGFLGIELEEKHNAANEGVIFAASSELCPRHSYNEEQIIAKTVCQVSALL